ncbi:MAG: NAD(P)/FAD-dependent oxidoreductase [Deltaproteobacteria bacterium]|nr:NAD(P)/FAD-dependent oxidoreductase [Deltaproteobacteria bacterium]
MSVKKIYKVDVLIVGTGPASAAAAKRLVDAGLKVVAIDFRKLPRHKVCSGILSPRGHRFLIENFGPLPREALHDPTSCRGVTFHFSSGISTPMDFFGGPTPHLHRKYSDYWAIEKSRVEVHDETAFLGLKTDGKLARISARHKGESVEYQARFVIGADGPNSPVRAAVYPEYSKTLPWFVVAQKFHRIIECPLDEDYFHFWINSKLGHYTWSHAREGRLILGVGFRKGGSVEEHHKRFVSYIKDKHGVRLEPSEEKEGGAHNFGPSIINRYVFGKENILITGQAAGFFNMLAEGMSCALHSGAIAGEAVIEAMQGKRPVQEIYRTHIVSEVARSTDQYNPLRMIFANVHEADFKAALKKLSRRDQLRAVRDLIKFISLYGELNWGRQIIGQSIRRLVTGSYSTKRWL